MSKPSILHLENNRFFIEEVIWVMDEFNNVDYDYAINEMEAKEKLKQKKPDLLVVDLMLNNDFDSTKGINFIEEIRKNDPMQKIMVLSARGDRVCREKLKDMVALYHTKDDIEEACVRMVALV